MAALIAGGIKHNGFALVDVFSPCVTYNKLQTYEWLRKAVYKLDDVQHDPTNIAKAQEKALEWGDKIPTGLFYRTEKPSFSDGDATLKTGGPLSKRSVTITKEQKESLLAQFR
jgi:2-oxoglutarate ferredoxin oxidoreductase subunit beta